MKLLENKVAVITGANSGVGAEAAKLFAEQGASVVIGARRVEPLKEVEEAIKGNGGKVLAVQLDISSPESAENLASAALEAFGKIDILVNNAGVSDNSFSGIASFDPAELQRLLSINTMGTMNTIKAVIAHMGEGASIVNVDSIGGALGMAGAAYTASKAAILGITKHIGLTYATRKIRCNAICPGGIITPMMTDIDYSKTDASVMGAIQSHTDGDIAPSTPQDIAGVLLMLASDYSRPLTGQIIISDFGSSL
ncbi:MAG: SDR family NAD(P)-dependent oxidoreductase [Hespellia sp.]|nr:SDR family NAD(P)-dependent oxidoreductase [Hespellia sp.]